MPCVGRFLLALTIPEEDEGSPLICWRSARAAIAQASPPEGDEEEAAISGDTQ